MSENRESERREQKRSTRKRRNTALLLIGVSILAGGATRLQAQLSSNAAVFATGLDYPRGLKFGPDGYLYVAEAGRGGANMTVGLCPQDETVGPFSGGPTARISRISSLGVRTTFAQGLPSAQGNAFLRGFVLGVADVAFLGDKLYALLAGGGCAHGNPDVPASVLRFNPDGSWQVIADLSAFLVAHPTAHLPADLDPDGTWYSLVAAKENLYALDPNQGDLERITPQGQISRVIDTSVEYDHSVPVGMAYHGNFYVGTLGDLPAEAGSSFILKITPSGQSKKVVTGLTAILGVTFDDRGRLYVLESITVGGFFGKGTGAVVRVNQDGSVETIATGLSFPSGITFGPDGALYVSNFGFGFFEELPLNSGQILRIDIPD
jgi:hypothetical protein